MFQTNKGGRGCDPGPWKKPPLVLDAVAALEALHPAGCVHDALLAREEGVTVAAHLHVQARLGRARLPGVAAGALNNGVDVLWVDLRFHRRYSVATGSTLTCLRRPLAYGANFTVPLTSE